MIYIVCFLFCGVIMCCRNYADAITYSQCVNWLGYRSNFSLNCSTDHVINIESAELWRSQISRQNGTCQPVDNCDATTQWQIMRCNGKRNCIFTSYNLVYPLGTSCRASKDWYFMLIRYSCIKSKTVVQSFANYNDGNCIVSLWHLYIQPKGVI